MVIGARPYQVIAERYGKPVAIAGFEPLDILQSLWMVLRQLAEGRCEVENQYTRLVNHDGNAVALDALAKVFTVREQFEWRGLGDIPASGFKMHPNYSQFDAEAKFTLPHQRVADHKACACGEILQGVKKPWECKVFGTACPEHPSALAWCLQKEPAPPITNMVQLKLLSRLKRWQNRVKGIAGK